MPVTGRGLLRSAKANDSSNADARNGQAVLWPFNMINSPSCLMRSPMISRMQGLQGRPTPPLYRRLRRCFMAGGRGSGQPTAGSFLISPTIADRTSVESSPKSAKPVSLLANNVCSTITCRGFSITANMKSIPIIGTPRRVRGRRGGGALYFLTLFGPYYGH